MGGPLCAAAPLAPNRNAVARKKHRYPKREGNAIPLRIRSVVPVPRIYRERRQSSRRTDLDFNLAPFPVALRVSWSVAHHILIPQLHADLRGDVAQVVQVSYRERPAARHRRQPLQKTRSRALLGSSVASIRVDNPNRIDLNVRLAQEAFDVAVIVATMIIASIGYDEQSFSRVACSFHLAHPQIHRVEERRHSLWRAEKQAVLQFLDAACEH